MNVVKGQRYRHYRNKHAYTVLGVGHHSETEEKVVVYQGEYADETFGENPVWVRPYELFIDEVEYEGIRQPRFERILE